MRRNGICKRMLSGLLALLLAFTSLPLSALAVEETGLCEHHTVHLDCGYREAVEGAECTHEHGEDCYEAVTACTHVHGDCGYEPAVEEIPCDHVHGDCGYSEGEEGIPCDHIHGDCGYAEGTAGCPCDHVCGEDCADGCIHLCGDGSCGFVEEIPGSACSHICGSGECAYRESVPGTDCTHDCTDGTCAWQAGKEAVLCTHVCSEESGCVTRQLNCSHIHEEDCGYKEAVEGSVCGYDCKICRLNALLEALPEEVTDENRQSVTEAVEAIDSLMAEMTEEELAQVELSRLTLTREALSKLKTPETVLDTDLTVTNGTCGDFMYWTYSESLGKLTIYGADIMYHYDSADSVPWAHLKDRIWHVVVQEGVDSIGNNAFNGCTELLTVSLPDGLQRIGVKAFLDCSSLKSIVIPESVVRMDSHMFFGCTSLEEITLPEELSVLGDYTFYKCSSLKSVVIPNGVTEIVYDMFNGCTALESVVIPDTVTAVDYSAFYECKSLKEVKLPSGVTSIGSWAFYNCESLESVNIPSGVTAIPDRAFWGCEALKEIEIPSGVTSIGVSAFSDCKSLTELTVPDGITVVPDNMVYGCTNLKSLTLPDSLQEIGRAAFGATGIETLTIPSGVTVLGESAFSQARSLRSVNIPEGVTSLEADTFWYCTALQKLTIPASVTSIGEEAFYECQTEITFEGDAPYFADNCFSYGTLTCHYPKTASGWYSSILVNYGGSVTWLPYGNAGDIVWELDGNGVLTISGSGEIPDYSYYEGAPWSTLEYDHVVIGEGITAIGSNAFYWEDMKTVTVEGDLQRIGSNAFYYCSSLNEITFLGSAPVIAEDAFYGSGFLVIYPADDESWSDVVQSDYSGTVSWLGMYPEVASGTADETLTWVLDSAGTLLIRGSGRVCNFSEEFDDLRYLVKNVYIAAGPSSIYFGAFKDCSNMVSVEIPGTVTGIDWHAFSGCRSLTKVDLPDSVTYIGYRAFADCTSLRSISFGWVETIDENAFENCTSLTKLYFPTSLTVIGEKAFYGCSGLEEIQFNYNCPTIGADAFDGVSAFALYPEDYEGWYPPISAGYGRELIWFGYSGSITKGSCGEAVNYYLDTSGNLMIYGSGPMYDFTDSYNSTPWGSESLTDVDILSGVTHIGSNAFRSEYSLAEIDIADTVTSIGEYAFCGCSSITKIYLNGIREIGESAFSGCSKLSSMYLPSGVCEIKEGTFRECSALSYISIPNTVSSIGKSAFYRCTSLGYVSLPWGVQEIPEYAFSGCTELASVSLPGSLKAINSFAFDNCDALASVTIPNSVTTIGTSAFWGCDALESVVLPPNLKQVEGFTMCSKLKSVTIPDGAAAIGEAAFFKCLALESVEIPGSVTAIGPDAFFNCSALTTVTFKGNPPSVGTDAFSGVTATAVYPMCAAAWTDAVKQSFGGTLTWVSDGQDHVEEPVEGREPTCGKVGLTAGTRCTVCGAAVVVQKEIPTTPHNFVNGVCTGCSGKAAKLLSQPQNVTGVSGDTLSVSFTAEGDGLTYAWYFANAGSESFIRTYTFTGNTYTMQMNDARNGRRIYCVVTDAYGNSVTTDTVTLSMRDKIPLQLISQENSAIAVAGETAYIRLKVQGEGLTYKWYYKNSNHTQFYRTTSVTGDTYSLEMTDARNGRSVYCIITDRFGDSVQTETVTFLKKTPLRILQQPQSVEAVEGANAVVSIRAEGDDLVYKWYFANKGVSTFSYTATFKGSSYTTQMNATRDGRRIYCVITDRYGDSVTTDTVTLTMREKTPLKILRQPSVSVGVAGEEVWFRVVAQGDGLTYKWYYANKTHTKFYRTESVTGDLYSIEMSSARDGRRVYCVVTDEYGNSVTSDTVTFTMKTPLQILSQTGSYAGAVGEEVWFRVAAQGDGLTYQWYYKNSTHTQFYPTTAVTGDTYSIEMSAARSGRSVYCVITDKYGDSVTSETVTFTKKTPLKITQQPQSVVAADGANAVISVRAEGDGLTYKWYFANKGATTFSYTATFKGSSYTTQMSAARDGRRIYCVITDRYGDSVQTQTVSLTMKTELKILNQTRKEVAAIGDTVWFKVEAQGDDLTYKWYYKNSTHTQFYLTTAVTGDTYSIEMSAARAGRSVYCVVTDKYGNTVTSDTVKFGKKTALKITQQPQSVVAEEGANAVISVRAEGEGLTYKWYFANKGATTFSYTATFKGSSYTTQMSAARDGRRIYCVITDKYGESVQTDTVSLTMK